MAIDQLTADLLEQVTRQTFTLLSGDDKAKTLDWLVILTAADDAALATYRETRDFRPALSAAAGAVHNALAPAARFRSPGHHPSHGYDR